MRVVELLPAGNFYVASGKPFNVTCSLVENHTTLNSSDMYFELDLRNGTVITLPSSVVNDT